MLPHLSEGVGEAVHGPGLLAGGHRRQLVHRPGVEVRVRVVAVVKVTVVVVMMVVILMAMILMVVILMVIILMVVILMVMILMVVILMMMILMMERVGDGSEGGVIVDI